LVTSGSSMNRMLHNAPLLYRFDFIGFCFLKIVVPPCGF
jgi:hypothetical protein